jgi:hypothetical protein
LLCSACHLAHHRGALTITGTVDRLEVHRSGQTPQASGPVPCPRPTTPLIAISADADMQHHDATTKDAGTGARNSNRTTASDVGTGAHVGAHDPASKTAGPEIRAVSKLDAAILCTQARAALTGLGWKPAIAHAAVDAAAAAQGPEMTLERLIFESLRRCPAPKA